MLDLEGPRLKLKRANEHIDFLAGEIKKFLGPPNPYKVDTEFDSKAKEIVLIGRILKRPDPMWSVIAGEFAHQVRSALNQTLYAVAPGRARREENTDWPIFVKEKEKGRDGIPSVKWLPTNAFAVVQAAQPYKRTDISPELDSLAILSALNNADKHRTPRLVWCANGLRVQITFPNGGEIKTFRVRPINGGRITNDGAPIARFHINSPKGTLMNMQPFHLMQVQFEEGGRSSNLPVVELCRAIHERVADLIYQFEANYP